MYLIGCVVLESQFEKGKEHLHVVLEILSQYYTSGEEEKATNKTEKSFHAFLFQLDSTKVQTLGAISESIMRQDTALQLAILFDGPRAHVVYTCQQSQFLTDWQHQQVNLTAHPLLPGALSS